MTLEALAQLAVQGDREALSQLTRALEAPVFRLCLRMLGSIADAQDCTQDVLVRVVTHLSQFEGRASLTTWVHQIAVRQLLAFRRSRAEERSLELPELAHLLEQGLALGDRLPPPTPEQLTLSREVRLTCTQGMLLTLGREDRLALVLVDVLGLDAAEAAIVCEVSHAALRQRLHRSREKLQTFVRERCGVVNPEAPCQCARQIAPKLAVGGLDPAAARYTALAREGGVSDEAAHGAMAELRAARNAAGLFQLDGPLAAPKHLRARLEAALPRVLGG